MSIGHEITLSQAHAVAQKYIGTQSELTPLGWGMSGFVFATPDARTAVKHYRYISGFLAEATCYRELKRRGVSSLCGFTIPRIHDSSNELRVIRMDIVSAPYLLDFAGAEFTPPQYTKDVMDSWHAKIKSEYGRNAWLAYAVFESLKRIGIYYMDIRRTNLNPLGHPDFEPETESADDEPY